MISLTNAKSLSISSDLRISLKEMGGVVYKICVFPEESTISGVI